MWPAYLKNGQLWLDLIPILLFAFLLSVAVAVIANRLQKNFQHAFAIALVFSFLGIVVGVLTGLSREPAVHAILPAVLTLIGGLFGYYATKSDAAQQAILITGIVTLCFSLLVGVFVGSELRDTAEKFPETVDYRKKRAYEDHQLAVLQVMHEAELQRLRDSYQPVTVTTPNVPTKAPSTASP